MENDDKIILESCYNAFENIEAVPADSENSIINKLADYYAKQGIVIGLTSTGEFKLFKIKNKEISNDKDKNTCESSNT